MGLMRALDFLAAAPPPRTMIIVLTGEEEFLREEALRHYAGALGGSHEIVAWTGTQDAGSFDLRGFLDDLRTGDLFGGGRILRLRDADAVVQAHGALFLRFFAAGEAVHPCVIEGRALLGKTAAREGPKSGFLGWVNTGGGILVRCDPLYDTPAGGRGLAWQSPLTQWVQARAACYRKRIGGEEAYLLHRLVGNQLRELDRELEKLALARPGQASLTARDIEELVGDGRLGEVFKVADALSGSGPGAGLDELDRLFEHGYSDAQGRRVRDAQSIAIALTAVLAQRLRRNLRLLELMGEGASFAEAAAEQRHPAFLLDRLRREVAELERRGDGPARLRRLGRVERALKSGGGPPRILLARLLAAEARQPRRVAGLR
jgi:DNA polymerase III delta subunit